MNLRSHQALLCVALTAVLSSCATVAPNATPATPRSAAVNIDKPASDATLVPKRESKELHQMIAQVDSEVSEFGQEAEAEAEEASIGKTAKQPVASPSTQANSPQNREPDGQSSMHWPPRQSSAMKRHCRPQLPQLLGSVAVDTH